MTAGAPRAVAVRPGRLADVERAERRRRVPQVRGDSDWVAGLTLSANVSVRLVPADGVELQWTNGLSFENQCVSTSRSQSRC